MKSRRYKPVCFFLVHMSDIPCGYPLPAVRAKYRAVVLGKVDRTVNDSVVEHFYKVTFPNLLIVRDEITAVGATHLKDMTAPDFSAMRIFENFHMPNLRFTLLFLLRVCATI